MVRTVLLSLNSFVVKFSNFPPLLFWSSFQAAIISFEYKCSQLDGDVWEDGANANKSERKLPACDARRETVDIRPRGTAIHSAVAAAQTATHVQ